MKFPIYDCKKTAKFVVIFNLQFTSLKVLTKSIKTKPYCRWNLVQRNNNVKCNSRKQGVVLKHFFIECIQGASLEGSHGKFGFMQI